MRELTRWLDQLNITAQSESFLWDVGELNVQHFVNSDEYVYDKNDSNIIFMCTDAVYTYSIRINIIRS